MHQRHPAQGEAPPGALPAQQVPDLLGAHGWAGRAPRFCGLPRGHLHQGGRGDPAGRADGLPRDDQHDALRGRRSQLRSRVLRRLDGSRGRGDDGQPRLRL